MKSLLFACSKKFLLVIFTFFYNEVRDGFFFYSITTAVGGFNLPPEEKK